jgi:hypothetical protein
MDEEEENKAIHYILANLLGKPTYLPLGPILNKLSIASYHYEALVDRLRHEELIQVVDSRGGREPYQLKLSPQGNTIARQPGGYLGTLQQKQQRANIEEQRAWLNTWGTFGSFIIAILALSFAIYTYYTTANDNKKLEQQVYNQSKRLRLLESYYNTNYK